MDHLKSSWCLYLCPMNQKCHYLALQETCIYSKCLETGLRLGGNRITWFSAEMRLLCVAHIPFPNPNPPPKKNDTGAATAPSWDVCPSSTNHDSIGKWQIPFSSDMIPTYIWASPRSPSLRWQSTYHDPIWQEIKLLLKWLQLRSRSMWFITIILCYNWTESPTPSCLPWLHWQSAKAPSDTDPIKI